MGGVVQGCLATLVGLTFWLVVALALLGKISGVLVILAVAAVFIYVWGERHRDPPTTGGMWR